MRYWLTLCLLCSYSFFAIAANEPSEADLKRLKKNITAAQQRISRSTGESQKLIQELRSTEKELASIERNIRNINLDSQKLQTSLQSLQQEENQLARLKQEQEQQMFEQITLSYRMGREKNLKLLLNQQNPNQLNRIRSYADYFNRAHVDALKAYQETLAAIQANKQSIESSSQALLANKEKLQQQRTRLQAHYQQRNTTLAKLKKDIQSDTQQVQKWQQEQKQLESLLDSVNQAISAIKLPSDSVAFSSMKKKLPWPAAGKRLLHFGQRRSTGDLRWEGITILANSGQSIHAVHHGRVVFSDWFNGKGLLMILDHGGGYMSLYAHSQTLLKETGDWVSAGETIATVGNSGGQSQDALYFEIRHQGKPQNPSHWLK